MRSAVRKEYKYIKFKMIKDSVIRWESKGVNFATLYKDVNPIINIPKMIMINPNGDDFIDLVKLAIIDC